MNFDDKDITARAKRAFLGIAIHLRDAAKAVGEEAAKAGVTDCTPAKSRRFLIGFLLYLERIESGDRPQDILDEVLKGIVIAEEGFADAQQVIVGRKAGTN